MLLISIGCTHSFSNQLIKTCFCFYSSVIYDQLLNKKTFVLDTDSDESSQFLFNKTQTNKTKVERNDDELLGGDWNSHNDNDTEAQKYKTVRKKGAQKEKDEVKKKKRGVKNKPKKKSVTEESLNHESIHEKEIDVVSKNKIGTGVYNNQQEEPDNDSHHQVEVDSKHPEETDQVNKYQKKAVLDNEHEANVDNKHEEENDLDNIHEEEEVVDTCPHEGEDNSNIVIDRYISAGS